MVATSELNMDPSAEDASPEHERAQVAVEEEFARMVVQVRQSVRERAAALDPSLVPFDFKVFTALWHTQAKPEGRLGLTSTELTALLESDKSMVSRSLKRLEALELLQRTADPTDARAQRITLTELGCKRYREAGPAGKHDLRSKLVTFSIEDLTELARLLHLLNERSFSS